MEPTNSFQNDLKVIEELVYNACGFEIKNLKQNKKSEEYGACSFELNEKNSAVPCF